MMRSPPDISIILLTFNHGKYIRQALASVEGQNVDANVQVVIADDCSSDETADICQNFAEQSRFEIIYRRRTFNVGMHKNLREAMFVSNGEFLTVLEGDDFWIGTEKINRQMEFLKAHPELPACFHRSDVVDEVSGKIVEAEPSGAGRRNVTLRDLMVGNPIHTSSVLMRRKYALNPCWFDKFAMCDWPMWILAARYGDIGYIDEVMSAYRRHPNGVWTGKRYLKRLTAVYEMFQGLLNEEVDIDRDLLELGLRHAFQSLSEYAENLERSKERLETEISEIRGSTTYRFGQVMLSPLSRLKRILKGLRGTIPH